MHTPPSSMKPVSQEQLENLRRRLARLYGDDCAGDLLERLHFLVGRYGVQFDDADFRTQWDEKDVLLITYGDNIHRPAEAPLRTLSRFCKQYLEGLFSTIHILPFYPWSSDDGFSVIDYREVDSNLGSWEDVSELGRNFDLMFDLVLNHCSAQSTWFGDFLVGIEPARHYFLERDSKEDLSHVVRPRTSPLLTPATTREGLTHVWTTFSPDQVDLNWKNPDVLFEFLDILMLYLSKGCRMLRLDAVAFLWKKIGTDCLHLPETHEVVKLLRDFLEIVAPHAVLLTETNVPHEENISYFGNGSNEAHMVYQFSLPPLLLHGLLNGTAKHISEWASKLPFPSNECTFLNFTASHDGIGVRPLQGLLPDSEIEELVEKVESRGGLISWKNNADGSRSPYELNITLVSALSEPNDESLGVERFLCSQAVALAMKGIPAVYIHSITGTQNYKDGVEATGRNRTINRRKWQEEELLHILEDRESMQATIFYRYSDMLRRRSEHLAFHPSSRQEILSLNDMVFGFIREDLTSGERITCLFNFSASEQSVKSSAVGGNISRVDLLTGSKIEAGEDIPLRPYQALWLLQN